VIGNCAGDENTIAALDEISSQPAAGRDDADAGRRHIQPVGCASADDLRVTGDDRHAGHRGSLGHVGDHLTELADGEAFLDDERRRQPVRMSPHHGKVIDRPVDGEVTDRSTRETKRFHYERVGGERQRLTVGKRDERRVGQRRSLETAEGVQEHGVDQRSRRLASGAVRQCDEVVPEPGPAASEGLDALEHGGFALAQSLA
jgi:hypothetical protein